MKTVNIIAIALAAIIVILLGIFIFVNPKQVPAPVQTTQTSSLSPDGHVQITMPVKNGTISSPVAIEGTVTGGGWFFEASFPVKILDANGKTIGTGNTEAQSDWTSTGTVPFSASISFTKPTTAIGTIILSKDNPSGLPANDESFSIPVRFFAESPTSTTPASGTSGVRGTVTIGPTCPVESATPNPACAPKPFETSILILKNIQNPEGFKTINTDASGAFSVELDPGEYVFQPRGGAKLPRCDEDLVTVKANMWIETALTCDSGVR